MVYYKPIPKARIDIYGYDYGYGYGHDFFLEINIFIKKFLSLIV